MKREQLEQWLKEQCNRYVNGQCQTLGCLRRGGWVQGNPVGYDLATCEPHEILKLLTPQQGQAG